MDLTRADKAILGTSVLATIIAALMLPGSW
jgi:hypothetical protein